MNNNYLILLRKKEWFEKRRIVLKRDGYKCRSCGSGKNLIVHHRQYHLDRITGIFHQPWEYKIKYLITLCSKCHEDGHHTYKVKTFNITFKSNGITG